MGIEEEVQKAIDGLTENQGKLQKLTTKYTYNSCYECPIILARKD